MSSLNDLQRTCNQHGLECGQKAAHVLFRAHKCSSRLLTSLRLCHSATRQRNQCWQCSSWHSTVVSCMAPVGRLRQSVPPPPSPDTGWNRHLQLGILSPIKGCSSSGLCGRHCVARVTQHISIQLHLWAGYVKGGAGSGDGEGGPLLTLWVVSDLVSRQLLPPCPLQQ
jgi:hypothetical protein